MKIVFTMFPMIVFVTAAVAAGEKMAPVLHVSVSIARAPEDVYAFASNPENITAWAAGLARAKIHRKADHWEADSPMGRVKIRFAEKNSFGVMDHDVTLPSGEITRNAFRVIPNGRHSEVVFSIVRPSKMSDEEFKKDTDQIRKDLETLKQKLESR